MRTKTEEKAEQAAGEPTGTEDQTKVGSRRVEQDAEDGRGRCRELW
jgi:hypothetical protein